MHPGKKLSRLVCKREIVLDYADYTVPMLLININMYTYVYILSKTDDDQFTNVSNNNSSHVENILIG